MDRSPEMTAFVSASIQALRQACTGAGERAAARVIDRLARTGDPGPAPATLPVCDWVAPALTQVAPERAALGAAFAALVPKLHWKRRASASPADVAFWNGHANALLLGPDGIETRDDLMIGATVMAPNTRYADHSHPPEEVYLSLTPGLWWNERMDWTDPGPTGFIYNPPGITHAMQSGAGPFLALWYLPL